MNGKRWVITSAIIVAGVRLWMQVRGKTKTPFAEWAIGYGVLFFFLALISESIGGPLAAVVTVADLVQNGSSLFEDITGAITSAGKGASTFTANPFGGSSSSSSAGGTLFDTATGTAPYAPPPGLTTYPQRGASSIGLAPLHTLG